MISDSSSWIVVGLVSAELQGRWALGLCTYVCYPHLLVTLSFVSPGQRRARAGDIFSSGGPLRVDLMSPCVNNSVTQKFWLGSLAFRFQHVSVLGEGGHGSVLSCWAILISIPSQRLGVTGTHRML